MKPLLITAHLRNGLISGDIWSPSLDSVLAYWHLKNILSDAQFAAGCAGVDYSGVIVDDLPIELERYGDDWWYKVSSPIVEINAKYSTHIHRRFDQVAAEKYLLPKKGRIQLQTGQHKNKRVKLFITITDRINWHVIGDRGKIETLLDNCDHLGGHINKGFGKISRWEISDKGDEETARFKRPLPADFAAEHGIEGIRMNWGYRPNVRKRENQTLCVMRA
jgi:CRISPR type IV-associated protein Csf3